MKKLLAAVTLLAVSTAQADTIYVDASCPGGDGSVGDPYCSIQTAISNAVDTDEIVVAPGTYNETIDFLGKAIWLRSSGGAAVTTIDATGLEASVVSCVSGEGPDTVLEGFTVTGGTGTWVENIGGILILLGGGMYNSDSSPTVNNCTFSGNTAGDHGGGIYNGGNTTVTDCTFIDNCADAGAGVFNDANATVTNCTISWNSADIGGGGMFNSSNASPTVTNCMFTGNYAPRGGGMANFQASSPTVNYCRFIDNFAGTHGGGMYSAGNPTVTNCIFAGNGTSWGGAMFNFQGNSRTVSNCTFFGNSAMSGNSVGFDSSNQNSPSDFVMTNCILWGGAGPVEIWNNDGSVLTVTYTNVEDGFPGIGNIDADPLFVDPDRGDWRLSPGSPCIDAGDNTAVPQGVLRDLDGNPRFIDSTFVGTMATVDMGAYEFQRSVGGGRAIGDGPWQRDILTLLGWNALPDLD